MKIGFIGTGLMGVPMIKNLLKSKNKISIFNRTIKKAENLRKYGAIVSLSIDQLVKDIEKEINKDAKFVVFHDAYQYFEERFGVRAAGALTLNTDVLPGAKQIADIQDVIKDRGIKCIFSEPQFNPKIISTIAEDMNIKTGVFDPLGANIDSNKDLYFKLIQNLGNELKGC